MHDGSFATLDQVVDYYNRGGSQGPGVDREIHALRLTAEESQALVMFLRSLNGVVTDGRGSFSRN
jgi:cytochrome c peroxidase